MAIYFTSDLHLGHDREFLYKPRGFNSIEEHDSAIIERWNSVVTDDDIVYVLGDLMLGDNEKGVENFNKLKGWKKIILGNHDTINRINNVYSKLNNTTILGYADMTAYKKYHFYLSHFPTMTSNLEKESLRQCVINLYGHTHQKTNFYNDLPFMYHVGLDSHNCYVVSIDQIIEDCKEKVKECKDLLT